MEGLIPMVYKSLKRSKARRGYECLPSSAAQTYNMDDFIVEDDDHDHDPDYPSRKEYSTPGNDMVSGSRGYNSVVDLDDDHAAGLAKDGATKSKQLVRFRSQGMFSCVTGA